MNQQLESKKTEVPRLPTYEELLKLVVELQAQLKWAMERIRQLEEENKILKKNFMARNLKETKTVVV